MKYLEDARHVVLLAALMSLLIVVAWVALVSIMARRTYWWMQGHSTSLARHQSQDDTAM
jgi:hypothetical protein